jgi:hypothetical protein
MNTVFTPDTVTTPTIIAIETAPVGVQVRMTPEEIRELVAKARAADEEKRLAKQALNKASTTDT